MVFGTWRLVFCILYLVFGSDIVIVIVSDVVIGVDVYCCFMGTGVGMGVGVGVGNVSVIVIAIVMVIRIVSGVGLYWSLLLV